MIRGLYVHNFRCLENFELPIAGLNSVLPIGDNGSGKSTVRQAIRILQRIARGENRIDNLLKPKDFAFGRKEVPITSEIDPELGQKVYQYIVAFELSSGNKELSVTQEKLTCEGLPTYARDRALLSVSKRNGGLQSAAPAFLIDWHLVALRLVQEKSNTDPLFVFRQ